MEQYKKDGVEVYNSEHKVIGRKVPNSDALMIKSKELEVSHEAIGFKRRENEPPKELPLKKGELVVLDSDRIFDEKSIRTTIHMLQSEPPRYVRFERRYREELKQAQAARNQEGIR